MDLLAFISRKVGIKVVKIRAFVGVIGSGKGYKCQKLKDEENYIQIDFADGLRNMVWRMLNWQPKNQEEYDLFKKGEFDIPRYGKLNGRLLLQYIGTDVFRKLDPDFWAKEWKNSVNDAIAQGFTEICCSDCRFENEINTIKSFKSKADVKIEFCDYHSDRYNSTNNHESELYAQNLLKQGYKDGDLV